MLDPFVLLCFVVVIALIFDYINGMHDTANSIATVVSTRVLRPIQAVVMAATLNLIGAFIGVEVAKTIGQGIVDGSGITQITILAALTGAIVWNMITWYFGIPSSSSHALIGGLCGAAAAKAGIGALHFDGLFEKVFTPMVVSPAAGLLTGFVIMTSLYWMLRKAKPGNVNRIFGRLQIASAGLMALSHGSNDAQKTMGIITLSLISYEVYKNPAYQADFHVPAWVIVACALFMGLGTLAGGWRIIHTMGSKMIKLQPINGFAAETSAAAMIFAASHMGMPVSTTHVISTSIMGVGAAKRFSAVRWGIVGSIVWAWVLTFPLSFVLSGLFFYGFQAIFPGF